MGSLTFDPSFAHDFSKLKGLFQPEKTIEQILSMPKESYTRTDGTLYFNRWQVTWILVKAPFNAIYYVFLKCVATLFDMLWAFRISRKIHVYANHCSDDLWKVFSQWSYGKNFLIPSVNGYQQELSDVYTQNSIKRTELKDEKISGLLSPLLKNVNFDRIGYGLCHGSVHWFNTIFLLGIKNENLQGLTVKDFLCSIAKQFENGQPRQAALIQTFYGLESSLLDLESTEVARVHLSDAKGFCVDCFENKETIPLGIYALKTPGHARSFVKLENGAFLWDPNQGLIAINSADELYYAISSHLTSKKSNYEISLSYHSLSY